MLRTGVEEEIVIETEKARLKGILAAPKDARGIVLFAHGSGSSRLSARNRFVAGELQKAGLGTLLMDLLEEWESEDRRKVFDIDLLAKRLLAVTDWVSANPAISDLKIGYFGASTGAAAALQAAAERGPHIGAVVSRGGRPDLATAYLPAVFAPTLLIVGGSDVQVLALNQEAYLLIPAVKQIAVVPGAGHLFEEPGALEEVARLAREWFVRHLAG